MWYVVVFVLVVAVTIIAFIRWRIAVVYRGAAERDSKIIPLIEPITAMIESNDPLINDAISKVAARPETRLVLYDFLRGEDRLDLFPERYQSQESQAESLLAYWVMHPNEFGDAPYEIEFFSTEHREIKGAEFDYHVFRFRMASEHWAAADEWILGVVGPYQMNDGLYPPAPMAFARVGDREGEVDPETVVDEFVGLEDG